MALSPDESIKRPPIIAAQFFQRGVSCGRSLLRREHNAPMGCGKGSCRTPLTIRAHAPLQSKNRAQITPAVCDVLCPAGGQSNSARKDFANREKLSRLRISFRAFQLRRDRTKEDFWNGW